MPGFLQKALFGSGPSTQNIYTDPNRVASNFNQFYNAAQGQLSPAIQRALGGASAFGPGFQGTSGILAGRALAPFLAQLMGTAAETATPTVIEHQGSAGLLGGVLSGVAPALGLMAAEPLGGWLSSLFKKGVGGATSGLLDAGSGAMNA